MSLWPDARSEPGALEPSRAPRSGLLQKITARLWGPRVGGAEDLVEKHESLWRLLHETDRWFESTAQWDTEGLYRVPGSSAQIDRLFNEWREGSISALPSDAAPHTVASLLKRGFRDLAEIEPVVPFGECAEPTRSSAVLAASLLSQYPSRPASAATPVPPPADFYAQFLDVAAVSAADAKSAVHYLGELLRSLPSRNRSLLGALLKHLRAVSRRSAANKMTTYNLAVSWAPNVLFSKEVTFRTLHEAPLVVRAFQLMLDHGAELLVEEASIGAVGAACSPSAVPPVLSAALSWIETTPGVLTDPALYAAAPLPASPAPPSATARGIRVQSCIDSLRHGCLAGRMPDFGVVPSDIAASTVSLLVLRFLDDAPQQIVPYDVIPALVNCLPLVTAAAASASGAAPASGPSGRARRTTSKEWHFLALHSGDAPAPAAGGSSRVAGSDAALAAVVAAAPPPSTPRHHVSFSSITASSSSRTLTTTSLSRRASTSDPRSTRGLPGRPLAPLSPELQQDREQWGGTAAGDAEVAGSGSGSSSEEQQPAWEHSAALLSISPADPAIDALRDCVQSLTPQSQNTLARLCVHLSLVAAAQASHHGEPLHVVTFVLAERLAGAVFRPQKPTAAAARARGPAADVSSGGGSDRGGAAPTAQPRILLQILALLIAFHRYVFGEYRWLGCRVIGGGWWAGLCVLWQMQWDRLASPSNAAPRHIGAPSSAAGSASGSTSNGGLSEMNTSAATFVAHGRAAGPTEVPVAAAPVVAAAPAAVAVPELPLSPDEAETSGHHVPSPARAPIVGGRGRPLPVAPPRREANQAPPSGFG